MATGDDWDHGTIGSCPLLMGGVTSKRTVSDPPIGERASKKMRGRSSASVHTSHRSKRKSGDDHEDASNAKALKTDAKLQLPFQPDGRPCKICKVKDNTLDHLLMQEFIKWAKPPKLDPTKLFLINEGFVCCLCDKLWRSQYKLKYPSTDMLKDAMTDTKTGEQLTAEVKNLRAVMIDEVVKQRRYNIKIDKSLTEQAQTLSRKRRTSLIIEDPVDEVWPEDYYKKEHGDYRTNGLGHRFGTLEGQTGVIVPGRPIKKVRRQRATEAELTDVVDDGTMRLTGDHMEQRYDELTKTMEMPKAVGMYVSSKGGAVSQAEHRVLPPLQAAPAEHCVLPPSGSLPSSSSTSSSLNSFGFNFMDTGPSEPDKPLPESTVRQPKTKAKKEAGATIRTTPTKARAPTIQAAPSPGGTPTGETRGRRKNDWAKLAEINVTSFTDSEMDDHTFFGAGHKAQKSFLKRVKDGVEEKQNSETDPEEIQKLTLMYKGITCACDLQDGFIRHGVQSPLLAQLVESKLGYCRMDPKVEPPPIPKFMLVAHNDFRAKEAPSSKDFWECATDERLNALGLSIAEHQADRTRMCKLRVIEQTRSNLGGKQASILHNMVTDIPGNITKEHLPKNLKALEMLTAVSLGKSVDAKLLEGALKLLDEKKCDLLDALTLFPCGRAIVEKARSRTQVVTQVLSKIDPIKALAVKLMGETTWTLELFVRS